MLLDKHKKKTMSLIHCCSNHQLADLLIKSLGKLRFEELRAKFGISKKTLKNEC